HELAHKLGDEKPTARDARKLAEQHGLRIPALLEGVDISFTGEPESDPPDRPLVVVHFPPQPSPGGNLLRFGGCTSYKTTQDGVNIVVTICIRCNVSLASVVCTATITAKASV